MEHITKLIKLISMYIYGNKMVLSSTRTHNESNNITQNDTSQSNVTWGNLTQNNINQNNINQNNIFQSNKTLNSINKNNAENTPNTSNPMNSPGSLQDTTTQNTTPQWLLNVFHTKENVYVRWRQSMDAFSNEMNELERLQARGTSQLDPDSLDLVNKANLKLGFYEYEMQKKINDCPKEEEQRDLELDLLRTRRGYTKFIADMLTTLEVPVPHDIRDEIRSILDRINLLENDAIAINSDYKESILDLREAIAQRSDEQQQQGILSSVSRIEQAGIADTFFGHFQDLQVDQSEGRASPSSDTSSISSNNSRSSLIDDYADLSTEMPSYIDPED